ncbi:MAG: alanine racemase [Nitrospirae bacterium]|nr:alanine racemase [Candidatus Troglogloeales bacterium]
MAFGDTIAEIDLGLLAKNLDRVVKQVGKRPIIAVVKANAYGHGAAAIAGHLVKSSRQVSMLGVASLDEGIAIREAGIKTSILLMTGFPVKRVKDVVAYRLTPALFDLPTLFALSRYARTARCGIAVHLKVDTGMGRLGVLPHEVPVFLQKAIDGGITVAGIFSHFAEADLADLTYAKEQCARFKKIEADIERASLEPAHTRPLFHLANSAAILHCPVALLDSVRPGLMLYGYSPLQKKKPLGLSPILTVKSRVIAIKRVPAGAAISYGRTFITKRETRVAVIGIGYADGYPRSLSNCGEMIAKGARVPVIGRVCMDMTMLDTTKVPALLVGDFVTVIGQEGKEGIFADELAKKENTIPYEILCGLKENIPRIYLKEL